MMPSTGQPSCKQRDQRAEDRAARDEAGGAVDRIEHPLATRAFVAGAVFLTDDPVGGELGLDQPAHRGLGGAVSFGDEAAVGLLFLAPLAAKQGTDRGPGKIGEAQGEGEIFIGHGASQ